MFKINNVKISTYKHNHGSIDVQTYRIKNFAYTTDFKKFYDNDIDNLKNVNSPHEVIKFIKENI